MTQNVFLKQTLIYPTCHLEYSNKTKKNNKFSVTITINDYKQNLFADISSLTKKTLCQGLQESEDLRFGWSQRGHSKGGICAIFFFE